MLGDDHSGEVGSRCMVIAVLLGQGK